MKPFVHMSSFVLVLLFGISTVSAAELAALDRVSVLMPKTEVVAILGSPDSVMDMGGLLVELYMVNHAEPLLSAGYFYEKNQVLGGHSFIFKGDVAAQTAARLKIHGFTVQEELKEYIRLSGKDDDTGRPIVVTISRIGDLTTVTTFEKNFYERRANQ